MPAIGHRQVIEGELIIATIYGPDLQGFTVTPHWIGKEVRELYASSRHEEYPGNSASRLAGQLAKRLPIGSGATHIKCESMTKDGSCFEHTVLIEE